ncbi:hypothetical protein GLOTRDRAFT_125646 [Gloeophyllum trabeum ATCC 11539]|uniref:Uncharacterized protein n=1 Tax=Gloeophyllum trabeum (strain ATCC 11539 / FP-39264 / Madison 617) TaxID=670483 RepID=S7QIZ8_GLOTA|nr:uncharacterized protein GLOTRDRAFT_125646 [Gloeophyllum trabeum ATCC 11539]EPQ59342.1 hypothetical protein GLOTRDRAFT_125646 [Gloeophyllum trabeum ATCC 11539]
MLQWNGNYHLTFTSGGDVQIYHCASLTDCHSPALKSVFTPSDHTYKTCGHPRCTPSTTTGTSSSPRRTPRIIRTIRIFTSKVSGISAWAIGGTVFTLNNQLYMVYSGWPEGDTSTLNQHLFITQLSNDASGNPTVGDHYVDGNAQYDWETFADLGGARHAINEGPAWLQRNNFQGILFSGCASWASCHSIGVLQFTGSDPMATSSWTKWADRFWQSNPNGPCVVQ